VTLTAVPEPSFVCILPGALLLIRRRVFILELENGQSFRAAWQVHHHQGRWRDVGQSAAFVEFFALEAIVHDDQFDVISGVGGVGAAGGGVDHLFAVAVVGGDDGAAALALDGVEDPAAADIDGFHGLNCGGENAGVADHVSVGEVDHDHVVQI